MAHVERQRHRAVFLLLEAGDAGRRGGLAAEQENVCPEGLAAPQVGHEGRLGAIGEQIFVSGFPRPRAGAPGGARLVVLVVVVVRVCVLIGQMHLVASTPVASAVGRSRERARKARARPSVAI